MTPRRFPLDGGRELLIAQHDGLVTLAVQDAARCLSGPLALRTPDVALLRAALGELADVQLAADMERVREVLRASPGIAGYDRVRGALSSMAMSRRRVAVAALRAAGEVVNRGTDRRPLLYIAPKADYFESRAPSTIGVHLDPCAGADGPVASGQAVVGPDGTTP